VTDEPSRTATVPADLEAFPRIVAWAEEAAAWLMLPSSTTYAIQLCLEEAFTNIVRHGYPAVDDRAGRGRDVRLSIEPVDADVTLTIEDWGIPFNPVEFHSLATPASIEDAIVGGQGIRLMRRFAQEMRYQRRGDCNVLRLRFTVTAKAGA
jgi:anti-sigma regulatory factor (Ser/Thr protein kinase)